MGFYSAKPLISIHIKTSYSFLNLNPAKIYFKKIVVILNKDELYRYMNLIIEYQSLYIIHVISL